MINARSCFLLGLLALGGLSACNGPGYSAATLMARGEQAMREDRPTEALANYNEALGKAPNNAEAYHGAGLALLELGRAGEAQERLSVAHDIAPDDDEILVDYAEALVSGGREGTAAQLLNDRAEFGDDETGYLLLGDFYRRRGLPDEAQTALRQADARAGGESIEAHRKLAMLYAKLGDTPAELIRWSYVLYLNPTDAQARVRVRELGEVPGPAFAVEPPGPGR